MHPDVSVVLPPYSHQVPLGRQTLVLGSILVADLRGGAEAVAQIVAAYQRAPWCPLCLVNDSQGISASLLWLLRRLPDWTAFCTAPTLSHGPSVDHVILAVKNRPSPTPIILATYVTQRVARPELSQALQACFRRAHRSESSVGPDRSWLSRRLRDFGPMTAKAWTAAAELLPVLQSQSATVDRCAYDQGLDPRTVRSRLQHFRVGSLAEARGLVGWEWLMEAVLRAGGYVRGENREKGSHQSQFA
jgi:hypothetical protein